MAQRSRRGGRIIIYVALIFNFNYCSSISLLEWYIKSQFRFRQSTYGNSPGSNPATHGRYRCDHPARFQGNSVYSRCIDDYKIP